MAIKLASGDISALYLGSTAVSAAYLGSSSVFTASGGSFDLDSVTGLQWWFDASDSTTITESSGDVSAIADKVAGTYSLEGYPAAAVYYPSLTASAENGLSALDFDGTNDFMRLPSGQKIALLSELTLFLVASPSSTANSYMLCDTYAASGAGRQPAILSGYNISGSGGSGSFEWYTLDSGKFQSFGAGLSGIQLLTLLYDSAGNTVLRRNGSQVSSGTSDTTFTSVAGFTGLGAAASSSAHAAFRFCELAAYDSVLTGSDLTDCEDHLLGKWGIA